MAFVIYVKFASDFVDSRDDGGAPIFNGSIDTKPIWLFRDDFLYGISGTIVVVHTKNCLDSLFHDDRVAQLPNRQWTTFNKAFNPKLGASVNQPWAKACLRHAPEERLFNLLVDDFTFKLAIKEFARRLEVGRNDDITLQCNLVTCVGQAAKLSNFDLLGRHDDVAPAWDVLQDVRNDDLFFFTLFELLSSCIGFFSFNHFSYISKLFLYDRVLFLT